MRTRAHTSLALPGMDPQAVSTHTPLQRWVHRLCPVRICSWGGGAELWKLPRLAAIFLRCDTARQVPSGTVLESHGDSLPSEASLH